VALLLADLATDGATDVTADLLAVLTRLPASLAECDRVSDTAAGDGLELWCRCLSKCRATGMPRGLRIDPSVREPRQRGAAGKATIASSRRQPGFSLGNGGTALPRFLVLPPAVAVSSSFSTISSMNSLEPSATE
jgi:hypothetical protein